MAKLGLIHTMIGMACVAILAGCGGNAVARVPGVTMPVSAVALTRGAPAAGNFQPTVFLSVPDVRQATEYTCGPSALQAVLGYWGIEAREDELAKAAHTTPQDGTTRFALAKVARTYGLKASVIMSLGIPALESYLQKGIPVIVSLQAWRDSPTVDYAKDWDDGHYVVVVGYDKDRIYVEDPSILGSTGWIGRAEFLTRWHDEDTGPNDHYEQLGIVVEGKTHRPIPQFMHVD